MKVTLEQLNKIIALYVKNTLAGTTDYTVTRNNLGGFVDKIGKQVILDGKFVDKLPELDGDFLPLGKTIEEYMQDLIAPQDYDPNGENALTPAYPTYRKPSYSYTLGRKKFKTTVKYDDYERAMVDEGALSRVTSTVTKRLTDSENLFRYGLKRQLIGVLGKKVLESQSTAKLYGATTPFEVGDYVKKDGGGTEYGIVINKLTSSNHGDWATAITNGDIVVNKMVGELAKPTDTKTGEDFIKTIKKDVEQAQEVTQGTSLNGGNVGIPEEGLFLFINQGVMPELEVDTFAGAFHKEDLMIPADIRVLKDFGDNKDIVAVLVDKRGIKVHNSYRATRENLNGDGDYVNFFRHSEDTGFISRNVFTKVYKAK